MASSVPRRIQTEDYVELLQFLHRDFEVHAASAGDGETHKTPRHSHAGWHILKKEGKMALKKIGVLWKKSDKHDKDYLTGQLDQ